MRATFLAPVFWFRGFGYLVRHPNLWGYVLAAFFVNLLVFGAGAFALYVWWGDLIALAPDWSGVVGEWVLGVLVVIAALVLSLLLFTIVGNAIAGPFLDLMCQRIMKDLGEKEPEPVPAGKAILRSLGRQAQKLGILLGLQAAAIALWLIPVAGAILYPIVAITLLAWSLGLEYLDYPLDVRSLPIKARIDFSFKYLGGTLCFGGLVALLSFVPFLTYFMLPISVAGATLMVHDLEPPAG